MRLLAELRIPFLSDEQTADIHRNNTQSPRHSPGHARQLPTSSNSENVLLLKYEDDPSICTTNITWDELTHKVLK
jgi:hypothetical protein